MPADDDDTVCGMPEGRPIYFALDVDPAGLTSLQRGAVERFLEDADGVIGRDAVGVYGLVDAPADPTEIAPIVLPDRGPAHLERRRRWWPLVAVILVGSLAAGWSVGEITSNGAGGERAVDVPVRPRVIEGLDLDQPGNPPHTTTAASPPPAPTTAPEPAAELIADTSSAAGQAAPPTAAPTVTPTTTTAVAAPVRPPATTTTTIGAPAPCVDACPDTGGMSCSPAYLWASDSLWHCQKPPCDQPRDIPGVGLTCDPEPTG